MVWVIDFVELVELKCSSVAFVSPDDIVINSKSLCEKIHLTYQTFGTVINPAAETKPIGLEAGAHAVMPAPTGSKILTEASGALGIFARMTTLLTEGCRF